MSGTIYIAASGALAFQKRLEIISNNLANINTKGFKEDLTLFRSYLPGPSDAVKADIEEYLASEEVDLLDPHLSNNFLVKVEDTITDFSPGDMRRTGNVLDLALEGDGFFCVNTPDGTQYTRKGNFTMNNDGVLVTEEGHPVLGNGGEIEVDGRDVVVDAQGNVSVDGNQIDTLRIVSFSDNSVLKKVGDVLFAPIDEQVSEESAEGVTVNQGFLESSNVNAVQAMVEMIEVLRGYESYQKILRSIDDLTLQTINEVGELA
ncbi:MAG: flagellar basal-body rod protein FlgF [Desulfatiglans sp.]|jgi:flagellar basal-body rod protein FlgG|nr:flagellar basal-body rod protein FlgF [Thermodesulfobacteriota bacterium]MEE4354449.1 flagellar basal-body rod protein FlgF [Desulfatiglans sp.]